MISLFKRLNVRGDVLDIYFFSKASKNRDYKMFHDLCYDLKKEVIKQSKSQPDELQLFPLDSRIVTLTSKLLWSQGLNQVKLFSGINLVTGYPGGLFIHFGQGHNHRYGDKTRLRYTA
jgi:putative transposase